MPASKHGEVQTNKSDGRKFITMKVGSNGEVLYQRIYLRTKDARLARQRAEVLDDIADPDEARRLIAYLESSRTPQQEQQRIAELTKNTPLIPAMTQEEARRELEGIVCDSGDYAPGKIEEDVTDAWRRAGTPSEWRKILLGLGIPEDYLNENPRAGVTRAGVRAHLDMNRAGVRAQLDISVDDGVQVV
ncbi:MAG: hypothetical protein QUV05_09165 [Phycisphaerae bacterium]|nr:hypothetical protein [Phycisphaerae bacterium]